MIGAKIEKPLQTAAQYAEYSQLAEWCNANGARIEDKGDWYEVCAIPEPEDIGIEDNSIAAQIENIKSRLAAIEAKLALFDGDLK